MSKPNVDSSGIAGNGESQAGPVQKLGPDELPQQLAILLESLKHKMVPMESIRVDKNSEMCRGKFGDVRQGRLEGHSELMAIKELRPGGNARDRLHVEVAFARELKVWEGLSHENVLSLVAFHLDSENGILLFVSIYTENGNVSKYLADAHPNMATRLQLSLDTATGLAYLHKRKICHGDLKGANVLIYIVDGRPVARLCDLGLSKIAEGGPTGLTTSSFDRKGTVRFFSPELLCDAPRRNSMSDMWAWACVVLEITTSRVPYCTALEDTSVMIRILSRHPPADEVQLPNHDGVREILTKCWNREPANRPVIDECRQQLAGLLGSPDGPVMASRETECRQDGGSNGGTLDAAAS